MLGFASPWPPSPTLLITSRRGGMRWSRVGCLSLGIDSPPFYGPPLCPSDPALSPTTPVVCRWDMPRACQESFSEEVVGTHG